jgi:histidyl-tRNA synthetase
MHTNPLRILDTKNPAMQDLVNAAPKLLDYLEGESVAHFEGVKRILDHNNVQYTVNPRLVRGLDYYNRTVFEWVTDALGSQGTVCAGGRYDPLIESFGGKPTPAVGFAMGIERLIELMKSAGEPAAPNACDVYMVHQGEQAQLQAFVLAERIRDAGLDVVLHCAAATGPGSFKNQMKKADASGAAFAVILGDDEIAGQTATVKALRGAEGTAQQSSVAFDSVVDYVVDQIIGGHDHDHDHDHVHYHP